MNYKKVLESIGFVENIDFSLVEEYFIMLEKTRKVSTGEFIHHEEVPAVTDTIQHEAILPEYQDVVHEEVLATFDNEGIELTPYIPAWTEQILIREGVDAWDEEIIITPYIPEWDEEILEDETYLPEAPSETLLEETWKDIQLRESDVAALVNLYLEDKKELRNLQEDFINISNGLIFEWSFSNIICPTKDELLALLPLYNANKAMDDLINTKVTEGGEMENDCIKCLQFITGYNDGRITGAQIVTMMQTFANINTALSNRMPKSAKKLLTDATVDGSIVTQELKDGCLFILRKYPLI